MTVSTVPGSIESNRKKYAIEVLEAFREREIENRRHRVLFIRLALAHGVSYAEIGTALGMTDRGVRKVLERAADGDPNIDQRERRCHGRLGPEELCPECGTYNPNPAEREADSDV